MLLRRCLAVPTFFLWPTVLILVTPAGWCVAAAARWERIDKHMLVWYCFSMFKCCFRLTWRFQLFSLVLHFVLGIFCAYGLWSRCFWIACWSDVRSMYSTVLMQACSQRFKAWAYHNLDFASQWFIPSAGRIASHASLLNMTSHVCGHLHHWKAVSTLRWCNRTPVACLRALVFNCLRPDDASMCE